MLPNFNNLCFNREKLLYASTERDIGIVLRGRGGRFVRLRAIDLSLSDPSKISIVASKISIAFAWTWTGTRSCVKM